MEKLIEVDTDISLFKSTWLDHGIECDWHIVILCDGIGYCLDQLEPDDDDWLWCWGDTESSSFVSNIASTSSMAAITVAEADSEPWE